MKHNDPVIDRILGDAVKESEAFDKRVIGKLEIGEYMRIMDKHVKWATDFLKETKGVDEQTAKKEHGILWTLVFRERKWYSRLITNYNDVVMLLVYHLKNRGVPIHRIEDIIDILTDDNKLC